MAINPKKYEEMPAPDARMQYFENIRKFKSYLIKQQITTVTREKYSRLCHGNCPKRSMR